MLQARSAARPLVLVGVAMAVAVASAPVRASVAASAATVALPTPLISLPATLPSLPTSVPTLSLPPLPTLTLPGLPSVVPSLSVGVPSAPAVTSSPGTVPVPQLPGFSPDGLGVAGPADGTGSAAAPTQVETSVLGALLGLLGTPADVGVEQPSLEHFDVHPALASGRLVGTTPPVVPPATPVSAVLWGLCIAGLVVLSAVGAARGHRRRLTRPRVLVAVPLGVLAGLMTVAAAQTLGAPRAPQPAAAGGVLAASSTHATGHAAVASAGTTLLSRVVAFEQQIGTAEATLQSPFTAPGGAQLRAEHAVAASLEATLQQEYSFFEQVAGDQGQSAALLQASAGQPVPIRNAITYDVQALQAHQAQLAAISQAAGRTATPRSRLSRRARLRRPPPTRQRWSGP